MISFCIILLFYNENVPFLVKYTQAYTVNRSSHTNFSNYTATMLLLLLLAMKLKLDCMQHRYIPNNARPKKAV